ncbi:MAG TPA: electron transfer flavoprotein subunit beta/FixA family protein, partial [Gaiellaceae bacterium]|nr:electron transfer flavoprotein subunit beta/FixA family protein [Gaiellaceae bacterium]
TGCVRLAWIVHAVVLLKQILDWELPPQRFRIDPQTKRPPDGLAPKLLGPFEQNALELALQLEQAGTVEKVTALLAGPADAVEALRKALAVRADEAVHVEVEEVDALDPSQTAELLVAALRRLGPPELVLAGRQAGDWDHGQVGYLVAERLGWPAVGLVFRGESRDGRLHVWRIGPSGVEQLAVRPPVVLTVTSHTDLRLRMGSVIDLMAANRKPIASWRPDELGLGSADLAAARRLELGEVWVPEVDRNCELIEGEDAAEVAARLLDRLAGLELLERPA